MSMIDAQLLLINNYKQLLQQMTIFKYFALIGDYVLTLGYELNVQSFSILIIMPPLLHTLTFFMSPHCHMMHCKPKRHIPQSSVSEPQNQSDQNGDSTPKYLPSKNSQGILEIQKKFGEDEKVKQKNNSAQLEVEYQNCKECGLVKWVRMHHCYYCNVCVHKYDHHCVLLGICIGEANQKYYLLFLWTFFICSFMQIFQYLSIIGDHLWVDEVGYEHVDWLYLYLSFAIIFFVLSILVVGYLSIYHTYLALKNDTTYEMRKRSQIYYLRGIIKNHPFDKGYLQNLKLMMMATSDSPIEWQKPEIPKIGMNKNYKRISFGSIEEKNIFGTNIK